MDVPINHDPDVLRSRLEPHFPTDFDDRQKTVAVNYLSEIDTLEKEQIAIMLTYLQVTVEKQVAVVEGLAQRLKGGKEVSKIIQATYNPRKRF